MRSLALSNVEEEWNRPRQKKWLFRNKTYKKKYIWNNYNDFLSAFEDLGFYFLTFLLRDLCNIQFF